MRSSRLTKLTCANINCSFEKCNLCSGSNLDWEANVYFSGQEVKCHELDREIFVDEGISSNSSRCEMSQGFYASTCCITAPEKPCNLCTTSNGEHFNMNSKTKVSYDGEYKSCLEVYHSLYSRQEQSSGHCIAAQGQLFGQCCEATTGSDSINGINDSASVDMQEEGKTASAPTVAPTTKPLTAFDTWYAGGISSSPASTNVISLGAFYFPMAVGLIIVCSSV